jgi:transposase
MAYRELSRMEIIEVVRRWQAGESQRAIARASGLARETVTKYLRAAERLGLRANGPPPTEEQMVQLVQAGRVATAPRTWAAPQQARLEPYQEQILSWLRDDRLLITRVQELLGQHGLRVSYGTLERFAWRLGVRPRGGQRGATMRCRVALRRDPAVSLKRDPGWAGSGHGLTRWSGGQASRCRACL